jgi:thiol:disulfide interchange protein
MSLSLRIVSSALLAGTLAASPAFAAGHYESEIQAALSQATNAEPVLVDFYADW